MNVKDTDKQETWHGILQLFFECSDLQCFVCRKKKWKKDNKEYHGKYSPHLLQNKPHIRSVRKIVS